MKKILAAMLTLSITACGGGTTDSGTPPPTGGSGGGGGGSTADFPIRNDNLVRYQHGNFIEYTGTFSFSGAPGLPAFNRTINITDTITASALPMQLNTEAGIQETMTRTNIVVASNGERTEERSDVIQFTGMPAQGSALYTYRTYDGPYNYCPFVQNDQCRGKLDIIGGYAPGASFDVEGFKSKGSTFFGVTSWASNDYRVRYRQTVRSKTVVSTPLGRFEVYPVDVYESEVGNIPATAGENYIMEGTMYVHPAIGVVKYTQKITVSGNQIYNVSYDITRTNLTY